jgi:hypothetical protein
MRFLVTTESAFFKVDGSGCGVENYDERHAFILKTRDKHHYAVRSGRL